MSAVTIGALTLSYDPDSGFVGVDAEGDVLGSFEMDDDTWANFEAAAQLPPGERTPGAAVIVAFSLGEAKALGLASIFGGPDRPHAPLEDARRKLREATTAAGGDIGF